MRLGPFIAQNTEPILAAWEAFAATILPGAQIPSAELRDHAAAILRATVADMAGDQTATQQVDKSQGHRQGNGASQRLNGASAEHGVGRLTSGFDLPQLVSEYRALRASVLSLWRKSQPNPGAQDVDDVNRFHESIDQSLAKAVSSYSRLVGESRDMFLAILGHDLRNPLGSISLSATLLQRSTDLAAEAPELTGQILTSAKAMSHMITDLLDYTRTRLGAGMPVSPQPMDLRAVCDDVIAEFRSAHPDADIRFHPTGDTAGRWDADRLRQVVSNLLGNAIQHGDRGAPVTVTLHGDSAGVTLAVANVGTPIPAAALRTIFDPLVRGTADARKPNPTGSIGLGLYIVRQLVLAHGGTIDVTSSAHAGTVFTARLPHGDEKAPPP